MSAAPATLPDVDAIIVAHDAGASLERAVASLDGQVAPDRITVVDSGSIDGAVDALVAARPETNVIRTEDRGIAAASNAGIVATSGEFVLLLDPGSVLEERCLAPLVSRAKSNRTAGIVSPRILDADASTQQGSFGPFPSLGRAFVLRTNRILHKLRRRSGEFRLEVHGTTPMDWVSGACMLVRRRAIQAVGSMDEGFVGHYQDIDWCRRMHAGGWTVLIEPSACCTHAAAGVPDGGAAKALRDDFLHYCRNYHLRAYALAGRLGLVKLNAMGGRG
jgi:hypothetical protein